MHYTYIVRCSDGSLYTGWTTDLKRRMAAHNSGHGAKYTKNRRPVTLVYYEAYHTKEEALRREYAIKQLRRKQKLQLCAAASSDAGICGGDADQGADRADGEADRTCTGESTVAGTINRRNHKDGDRIADTNDEAAIK